MNLNRTRKPRGKSVDVNAFLPIWKRETAAGKTIGQIAIILNAELGTAYEVDERGGCQGLSTFVSNTRNAMAKSLYEKHRRTLEDWQLHKRTDDLKAFEKKVEKFLDEQLPSPARRGKNKAAIADIVSQFSFDLDAPQMGDLDTPQESENDDNVINV
jgi:hypothetical protein